MPFQKIQIGKAVAIGCAPDRAADPARHSAARRTAAVGTRTVGQAGRFAPQSCARRSPNCRTAGLLATRAGAGIFVADVLGSAFSPALIRLFAAHDEAVFDYIAFRRDMEGLAAERAARLGSDTDLKVIDAIFRKMEAAHSKRNPADEASAGRGISPVDHRGQPQRGHAAHDAVDVRAAARGRVLQSSDHVQAAHHAGRICWTSTGRSTTPCRQRDPAGARAAVEAHLNYVRCRPDGPAARRRRTRRSRSSGSSMKKSGPEVQASIQSVSTKLYRRPERIRAANVVSGRRLNTLPAVQGDAP